MPHSEGGPLRLLLASIVDFAGLFPPAGLDMASAARAYDRYRRGEHAWLLGSFVVPLGRVGELAEAVEGLDQAGRLGDSCWPISVLAPTVAEGARLLGKDGRLGADHLQVRALEIGPLDADDIRRAHDGLAERVQVFYEVPLDGAMEARLDAIAEVGAAAKVRTGGVRPEAFPSPARLADMLLACAERRLPLKATAGLHHPIRGRYALTYEPESPDAEMYGFLEVALVADLVMHQRIDARETTRLLSSGAGSLEIGSDVVSWRGHSVTSPEISSLRRGFFRSFGSCSFEDPVADLKRLGLL